jgi:carboxypeptidase Q
MDGREAGGGRASDPLMRAVRGGSLFSAHRNKAVMRSVRMAAVLFTILVAAGGAQKSASPPKPIVTTSAQPGETIDYRVLTEIRDEGLNRSQVMDMVSWLADVYGPRLAGSPSHKQAADWAAKKMNELGFSNVHVERWPFGRGWQINKFYASMTEPQVMPLIGTVRAWTKGTNGSVVADVVQAVITSEADFEKYRGKLAGKIVLTQPAREVGLLEGHVSWRMDDGLLREAETMPIRSGRAAAARPGMAAPALQNKINQFFVDEKVAVAIDRGSDDFVVAAGGPENLSWITQRTDGGTVFVTGRNTLVPAVTIAVEQYNRMVRILDKHLPVKMEVQIDTQFFDETDKNGTNLFGELPGTDLAREVVLLGAHLDTEPGATGATDDAAGCAAMMEALRILKAIGAKPRRTIRVALWDGEESGRLGSRAYVRDHLADVKTMTLKPEHDTLSAYYNLDNGTGRIRGIWMQFNIAVRPIFQQWIEPLRDRGVTTLAPRGDGNSDYLSFDEAGIPAFQFIQDRLEYMSRTHHSNMDYVDRVQRDDMLQMAVVVASVAYQTAMRDERLPRKPLPAKVGAGG